MTLETGAGMAGIVASGLGVSTGIEGLGATISALGTSGFAVGVGFGATTSPLGANKGAWILGASFLPGS